ncbi:MAG: DUF445 domain-containing protein [Sphingobacteriales bacterium]|jgi:uncharacterized membrane-anchored protein YjiN (DUF445 family)|nr:DUF445 domain-containing protein [Sphingobacteriales bacterium]
MAANLKEQKIVNCFIFIAVNDLDIIKRKQLRQHKKLATGLFLLMLCIYIVCIYFMKYYFFAWIGYVKVFSEAAMVGALADWFAVTALFHHPMGIPIPHTNLIVNRKKSIGDNLGGFVVENFLNPTTIRPYIQRLQLSSFIAGWLNNKKNLELTSNEILWLLKDIIEKTDEHMVVKFITAKSKDILNNIHLNEILAGGIQQVVQRGDHERILDYIIDKLRNYITNNEDQVRDRVKQESYLLIPEFVDNLIASKLVKGATKYLTEIEKNPNHQIRKDILSQLNGFVKEIRTSQKWEDELQEIKNNLLTKDRIQSYAAAAWKTLQKSVLSDLSAEKSAVKLYIKKMVAEIATSLKQDEVMQNKIDGWIRFNLYRLILHNTEKMGELISNTVGDWEGRELSNKLELEVGKDLQYIRINGTLVGGLVGLLIYMLTKLI